jgi:hypothetical protein
MPNADSKNKNARQIKQLILVILLYEFTITRRKNIRLAKTIPIFQANFLGAAPTYSGVCLLTTNRPIISRGENFGLIKTRISKSVRNTEMTYLISKKLSLNRMNIKATNINTNRIPADALISLSFKTGALYPSTSSPNFINLFAFFIFLILNKRRFLLFL